LAVGAGEKVEVYRPGLDHLHTIRPGLGQINAVAFDPNGALAVSGAAERIQLWQIRPVQLSSWEVLGHETPAIQLKANPAHNVLAAITDSDQVLVWDLDAGPESPVDLTGDLSNVNALAFSPDGGLLAAGDEAGRILLWDWHSRAVALEIDAYAPVLALAFTPHDGGAHLLVGHEGGRVRVWKIK
jgi:WD40 repeat protein